MAAEKRFGLGLCKLSTLLLAKEIGADLVILDDFGVRKLAQREGFRVQGTMAILEARFRKGYLTDLRVVSTQLLKRGVFLNRNVLKPHARIVETRAHLRLMTRPRRTFHSSLA